MNEVNWNVAPVDATHHGKINNPDVIAWYRYESRPNDSFQWSYWYSELGILNVGGWKPLPAGQIPLQLPLTPRPTFVAPPILRNEWVPGQDLPPIGIECEFAVDYLAENSSLYKKDIKAGTRVLIIAHIENPIYDIAAFLYKDENGNNLVRQAIAEVFRPLRTEEEIAAEKAKVKRRKYVDDLLKELGYPQFSEARQVIKNLYDKGMFTEND